LKKQSLAALNVITETINLKDWYHDINYGSFWEILT